MRYTKTWTISLPPEMETEAERIAHDEHRTKSELVREALRSYIVQREFRRLQRVIAKQARRRGIRGARAIDKLIHDLRK